MMRVISDCGYQEITAHFPLRPEDGPANERKVFELTQFEPGAFLRETILITLLRIVNAKRGAKTRPFLQID